MEGEVYLNIKTAKYEELKEKAIQDYYESNGEATEVTGEFIFTKIPADLYDVSDDNIGIGFQTPLGYVTVYIKPDRKFLADVSKVAVERVNKAISMLENGAQ